MVSQTTQIRKKKKKKKTQTKKKKKTTTTTTPYFQEKTRHGDKTIKTMIPVVPESGLHGIKGFPESQRLQVLCCIAIRENSNLKHPLPTATSSILSNLLPIPREADPPHPKDDPHNIINARYVGVPRDLSITADTIDFCDLAQVAITYSVVIRAHISTRTTHHADTRHEYESPMIIRTTTGDLTNGIIFLELTFNQAHGTRNNYLKIDFTFDQIISQGELNTIAKYAREHIDTPHQLRDPQTTVSRITCSTSIVWIDMHTDIEHSVRQHKITTRKATLDEFWGTLTTPNELIGKLLEGQGEDMHAAASNHIIRHGLLKYQIRPGHDNGAEVVVHKNTK